MTNYATNYTARLRVRYSQGGNQHTYQLRAPHGAVGAEADLIQRANAIHGALLPILFEDWQVIGADFADRDSDLFLPVAGVDPVVTTSAAEPVGYLRPAFIAAQGRSAGGSKARVSFFGTLLQPSAGLFAHDYRVFIGESGVVQTLLTVLNAGAFGSSLGAVDGGAVQWYPYVNTGYNAHWQRAARG